jgi:drug/metabolite transporter (DMT)-like permease
VAYQGEIAAILAAALWAVASLLYVRLPWSAWNLAAAKNLLATLLLVLLLVTCWAATGRPVAAASRSQISLLALSALIGLAIGDTAYFRSLQILGPRKALSLTLLTPPVTAWLGFVVLDEVLPASIWVAMALILAGILLVVMEGTKPGEAAETMPGPFWFGVISAGIAIIGQAVSSIMIKMGSQGLPSLEATIIRLLVASVCGVAGSWLCDYRGLREMVRLADGVVFLRLLIATTCGTVLGVWLMLIAFQQAPVGVAATLTSMSPLFVLPLVVFVLRQQVSFRGIVGAIVAVFGVYWLFFVDLHL